MAFLIANIHKDGAFHSHTLEITLVRKIMAYICIYFHIPTTSCDPGYTARQYKGLRIKRAVSTSEDRIDCGPFNHPRIHWDLTSCAWWGSGLLCTPQTGTGRPSESLHKILNHIKARHEYYRMPCGKEAEGKAHAACLILLQGGRLWGWRIRMRDEANLLGEGEKQKTAQLPKAWAVINPGPSG